MSGRLGELLVRENLISMAQLKKAQDLDDTEHRMYPFIEKFKSIKEAVAKFGRI